MSAEDDYKDILDSVGIDIRELFLSEIMKYTASDMEYAVKHNVDLTNAVIKRLDDYNERLHVIKVLVRTFWGRLAYIFEHPEILTNYLFKQKPELRVSGAEEYLKTQIRKIGYAMADWVSPSEKVRVKLDKKAMKFAKKRSK